MKCRCGATERVAVGNSKADSSGVPKADYLHEEPKDHAREDRYAELWNYPLDAGDDPHECAILLTQELEQILWDTRSVAGPAWWQMAHRKRCCSDYRRASHLRPASLNAHPLCAPMRRREQCHSPIR
jgi:hypothetical protein